MEIVLFSFLYSYKLCLKLGCRGNHLGALSTSSFCLHCFALNSINQVGFNDYRKGSSPQEIQEKFLSMQLEYFEKYPLARQHIMAIPPIGKTHGDVNDVLQKLSKFTETNFISLKALRDTRTERIRPNLMYGIHYNEYGIKLVARDIKKSLYSDANRENRQLKVLNEVMTNDTHTNDTHTNASNEPSAMDTSNEVVSTTPSAE